MRVTRFRMPMWFASGAAVGLVAAVLTTQAWSASAAIDPAETTFVPITPCRLLDTRPAPDNIGPRATPIGAGEELTVHVTGEVAGNCVIPSEAEGVAINLTAVNATSPTFVSLYPGDVENPGTSAANVVPGQSPTPNEVVVKLAANGTIKMFN